MAGHNSSLVVDFDPLLQNITFLSKDGVENVATMAAINMVARDMTLGGIQQGTQMGACLLVAGMLLIVTPRDSLKKLLFVFNFVSLILAFVRSLFTTLYYTSPWAMFYTQFSNDLSYVQPVHYSYSYVSVLVSTFLTITVHASLILQAHAVCIQLHRRWQRWVLIAISFVVILIVISFRLALCIATIKGFKSRVPTSRYWIQKTSVASNMFGLLWFMGIFMWKLIYTVYVRHRMGWARMSVFRILVIASCFTMIIPFMFTILEFAETQVLRSVDISSWTMTTAALFLPLSTIWAKASLETENASLRFSRDSQRSNNGCSGACSHFPSQSSTVAVSERKGSFVPLTTPINKSTIDTIIEHTPLPHNIRDSTEIDLERMGVRVDRSYAVNEAR